MLPPTENGFRAYIRTRFGETNKNVAMKQLYSRYAYLIDQIQAPDISAAELDLLRNCAHSTWLQNDEDPIELLQRMLVVKEMDICNSYYIEKNFMVEQGKYYDSEEPSKAREYRNLFEKVSKWSPMQGLKVIEAIECLDAEHAHIVDLTAEAMVLLLRGRRDKEMMRRRRTNLPAYLLTRPDQSPSRSKDGDEE